MIHLHRQPNYQSLDPVTPVYTHDQRKADGQRFHHLDCKSKAGCIASTITSFLCCPITLPFAILCGCVSCCNEKDDSCINSILCERKDPKGEGYCDWSTCEGPCWHKALPPENFGQMCLLGLDCCPFRCKKGVAESYFLLDEERKEFQNLKTRLQRDAEVDSILVHMPTDVSHLITEAIVLDRVQEDQPPEDDRKAKSLSVFKTDGSYSYGYPTSSGCAIM